MKALTLHQPWASLMAAGIKTIETRHWATNYRGRLAIHAGKKVCFDDELLQLLKCEDTDLLPRGAVLCIVELQFIQNTEFVKGLSNSEYLCGDFSDGRFAWRTKLLRVFDVPIPAIGHQGLWNWQEP